VASQSVFSVAFNDYFLAGEVSFFSSISLPSPASLNQYLVTEEVFNNLKVIKL